MSEFYVAILANNSEGEIFATVPDLPGANSAAATEREALALVIDFANDYVADLVADGHDVPPARSLSEIDLDPEDNEIGRALIPVDVPGKSVKISISVEEALLARADRAAGAEGLSRSGYIAAAIGERLRSRREVKAATGIPEFLSRFHDAQIMAEQRSGPVLVVPMDGGQQNMNLFQRIIGAFEKGADVPVADRAKAVSKKSA